MGISKFSPSGRSGSKYQVNIINDINVTPLVDVMLVLLIIFMVTTPMVISEINVDLPKVSKSASAVNEKPVVISVGKDGRVYLNDKYVKSNELIKNIKNHTKEDFEKRIYLYGDTAINYGKIVAIFAQLNQAGFAKVALVAEATG